MTTAKNERLVNLLICLMSTRQFITAERIRRSVLAYGTDDSVKGQQAFERKFERDKEELRDLGVEIETGTNSVFDTTPGYRIAGRDAKLPAIELTPDEAAVVAVAAEWWKSAQFESASAGAVQKLRAGGIEIDRSPLGELDPHLRTRPAAFDPMLQASEQRSVVSFDYRGAWATEPITRRRLQPWGLTSWKGKWYVAGQDLDREAPRIFRLSRIAGDVEIASGPNAFTRPDGIDLSAMLRTGGIDPAIRAVIKIHRGEAMSLRRCAVAGTAADATVFEVEVRDAGFLGSLISQYDDAVEVVGPPDVRAAVAARLAELATIGGAQ